MNALTPGEIMASLQTGLAVQQTQWTALTHAIFENAMRLVDVNLKWSRDSMDASAKKNQQLLSAKTPEELYSLSMKRGQANFESMLSYGRDVADVVSIMQEKINQAAQGQFSSLLESITTALAPDTGKVISAGPQDPIEMMKSVVAQTNDGYKQWTQMSKQVTDNIETNLKMLTGNADSAKKKAESSVRKNNAH